MKARKRMRGTAVVTAVVVVSGLAAAGSASADSTTTTKPAAGPSGGPGETITVTIPSHTPGGTGGSGGSGSGNSGGSGNAGGSGGSGNSGGAGSQGGAGGAGNSQGAGGAGGAGASGGSGELSVAVPTAGTVTFSGSGTTAQGHLGPVTVSDTRQSSPGWTVFGQASYSGRTIPGDPLGWTPTVTSSSGRVTVGRAVPPNSPGLGSRAARLGYSTGPSTATLGANLSLALPAGQSAGSLGITITITITTAGL